MKKHHVLVRLRFHIEPPVGRAPPRPQAVGHGGFAFGWRCCNPGVQGVEPVRMRAPELRVVEHHGLSVNREGKQKIRMKVLNSDRHRGFILADECRLSWSSISRQSEQSAHVSSRLELRRSLPRPSKNE